MISGLTVLQICTGPCNAILLRPTWALPAHASRVSCKPFSFQQRNRSTSDPLVAKEVRKSRESSGSSRTFAIRSQGGGNSRSSKEDDAFEAVASCSFVEGGNLVENQACARQGKVIVPQLFLRLKESERCSSNTAFPWEQPSRRQVVAIAGTALISAAFSSGSVAESKAVSASAMSTLVPPGKEIAPGLVPSSIIKGTWQLSGGHRGERDSDRTGGKEAVQDFVPFVEAGINTFDTADIYGPAESLIGQFLKKYPERRGSTLVFTKCCLFGQSQLSPGVKAIEKGIDRSRQNLGVEVLDLVQFYWQDYAVPNYVRAAQSLAELQAKGKIRYIGVTNFDIQRLREIKDAGVQVVANQLQYSLLDRRPENGTVEFCRENGIALLPFGTVAGGFLTERYLGVSEGAAASGVDTYSKGKYLAVIKKVGGWGWFQTLLQALNEIAQKHSVSIADIATKWVLGRPQVASVIVGARNARHVDDHRRIFTFELDTDDLSKIDGVLALSPRPKGDVYTWERGGVF